MATNYMYTLPSKLKLFSIILVVAGLIGIVYGFMTTPKTVEDVKHILSAQEDHHSANGASAEATNFVDTARGEIGYSEAALKQSKDLGEDSHGSSSHEEHVLHQMQTRPWSATFVSAFFFLMIGLGILVFYAIQVVSQAGWSPVLYRIMHGMTAFVLPGSIIVFLLVVFAGTHFFPWQNDELVAGDKILQIKSGFLNFPFFVIRAFIYILGWNLYRHFARKYSLEQETASDYTPFRKSFKISVYFLAFFFITEAFMAIDWFMTLTPHWYSTLFPWYVFSSMFVSAITALALITIYLRGKGLVSFISDKHLHDLAKYIFAFSIFWTYLWFSQFMLIWYANIPEEVAYFVIRIKEYNLLFFGMLILNFVFPFLMLMNSDYKKVPWFIVMTGIVVLVGHFIDIFLLVMPSTVGQYWHFGIPEIGALCFFLGLFILFVGNGLSKVSLRPKNDPFITESENYHF
ncbi:quinol:cytochrome C oxidoreductase [Aequorivita viscosa]|uniref:Quinol:cytochrome c oxidoreductase quinone-binding subunit 2 n=1 Tax=Aequorivita viscosa TaxID=797419 RepID=A0A1M6AF78_9FLAO|nr:quinol:cytochrome C oxidoreductase [Aequorivita viscosa]SDW15215.1 quinol:cytochrome c oxidoreductase quinone-binding subunit 2 [Aequorivita viscosa]SHI35204.1 quinol:cytochrome c oxidoreductase quinone-binding subunit 2 [Aequorivita viscosa]